MNVVNLEAGFDSIEEYWSPKIAAELNGQHVKLARLKGEFEWHHHADADELFLVVEGRLVIELREEDDLRLEAGELVAIPAGVEHRPVADEEVQVLLFEPAGTENTGNVEESELSNEAAWL
ncbi:cupin domain-containing protein [Natronomonas sp. EA1]|uniref:cupin domain-containing protein n=1 Tax=Natronomonas sp. EA1 TaxID=3421655 RepID=UPI003EBF3DAA